MAARIRSLRNGITPVDEASRDDLVVGDVVTVSSLDPATTYAWSITFAPQGSTATFSGSPVAVSPGTFTVDVEGPYLVRLVVDATLPTESTQYVRLRALTEFGQMTLVAAGERRDATGIIPVDADPEGWANDQNYNLQTLKGFIKPFANSGRVLQVDANSGTTGYGDYDNIQDAIDAADTAGASASDQWVILVHPGTYAENLTLRPFVHVVGWPAARDSRTVLVDGTHTAAMANAGDTCEVHGIAMNRTAPAATAVLVTSGLGTVRLWDCTVTSPGVGPAVRVIGGTCTITDSALVQTGAASTRRALVVEGANSSTTVVRSTLTGPSGVRVNDALDLGVSLSLVDCTVTSTDAAGFGLSGQANTVRVTQTVFTGAGTAVSFGNPGAAMAEAASLDMSFTTASTIVFDTNNLAGGSTLNLGSVNYTTLSLPSGAPTTYAATTQARTIYYDNAASGLTSTNVQAAIDEIAGGGGAPPLSAVLTSGNSTGGSNIVLTTGDILLGESGVGLAGDAVLRGGTDTGAGPTNGGDVILRPGEGAGAGSDGAVVVRSADGASSVRLTSTAAEELTVGTTFPMVYDGTTGKLTVPGVIDPTALVLSDPAAGTNLYLESANGQTAAVAPAGKGRIRYNNATTQWEQSVNGGAYTAIGAGGGGSGGTVLYQEDVPPTPGSTVQFQGWVPVAATLQAVRVYMAGVNTVGTYTVAVTNVGTGNTCLVAATFDMNTLVAGVVTTLTLTATPADLSFLALGQWTVAFTSNNPGFDGTGIYFDLQFGIGSTGVSGQDIATTLTLGNATGGNDIILTTGDQVVGEGLLGGAGDAVVRGGTPTGGVANGGDVILRPGAGAGGGTDGAVIVRSANAATSVRLTSTAAEELTVGTTFPMVYNGTTGKLTVPGLIDPTGVVFEASTVPTTGATEGAIFVSDGSSSLVSGQLYYRSPSNGSVTPLDRVTWSGTTTDNIATELFVNGVASSRYVLVDDSALKFTLEVVALSSDGLATGFKVSSVIKRGVGVASTAMVGTPVTETTGSDPALSTATLVVMADTTNGALSILVQGVSLKTIKWVVSMTAATIVY